MPSTLARVGLGLVLLLVPPSSWTFSQGADDASCQEMVPGHIQAQRQYLQHSHISLRTSASSYLPGQLVTVTVRSSRDFMGFLVQARSARGAWDGSRAGAGVRSRAVGLRSTRPVLVGGSWVLTPPGTHTLRCLSAGDTLTHSDKQPKRNLSFVWRAPDAPMGDIRFYVTVVQSYFVYWAGIESAVLRDGSQSNTSSSSPTTQEGEVTANTREHTNHPQIPHRVHGPSENESAGSATQTSGATQRDVNRSAAPAPSGAQKHTDRVVSSGDRPQALGPSHGVATDNKADSGPALRSHVSGEAAVHTGSPAPQSQDPNASLTPSHKAPLPSADATQMEATSLAMPSVTMRVSSAPHPPEMERRKPNVYFKDQTTFVPSTIQHVPSTRPQRDTTHDAGDLHRTSSHSGSQSWSTKPQTSTTKQPLDPLLQPHTPPPRMLFKAPPPSPRPVLITSDASPASQTSTPTVFSQPQTSLLTAEPHLTPHSLALKRQVSQASSHFQLVSDSASPQPGARQFGLQSEPGETSAVRSPRPFSSFPQALPVTTDSPAQSEVPPEALSVLHQPWPQPHSQPEAKPVQPRSSGPVLFPAGHVNEGGEVKGYQLLEKLRSTNPTSASASITTSLAYSAAFTQKSPLRSSASTYASPSLGHGSSNTALGSIRPSVGNQPQTAAAILALPSPLPGSVPPRFPSAEPASPSSASATVPFSNFSKHVSSTALFSSSVSSQSSFPSSQHVTGSTLSSSTVSAVITSSSIASLNSPVSSSSFPPSSSSSMSFHSTTPHPGPSPAPRRSLYSPVSSVSPVPLQRVTVGQRLLIHNHMSPSKPELNLNPPTPGTVVYPNPLPHPDPLDLNPNSDGKPKHPSIPSKAPDKEGKYPDIVPRHSAWELGMLLGCSAGLGMVLVVGVRYVHRQACGKKTQMTLNDREREYGRGERGLIHVQECGDLVRVRRIRENSFVLLAEYDILTSPGD